MHVCLVTRRLTSSPGDGIVTWASVVHALLAEHTVSVVTIDPRAGELAGVDGVRHVSLGHVDEHPGCHSWAIGDAAAVLDAVRSIAAERGIDVVLAPEEDGLVHAVLGARRGADALLGTAAICVRLTGMGAWRRLHDGDPSDDLEAAIAAAMERDVLRHADLVWAPDAATLATHERVRGADALGPVAVIEPPTVDVAPLRRAVTTGAVRLLYWGRLGRGDGVLDAADGFRRVAGDGWALTISGVDTATAPLGASVRETLAAIAAEDHRITLVDEPDVALDEHDALVAPARFAAPDDALRRALAAGLPALVTPVGAHASLVATHRGWVCDGTGRAALADGLRTVLGDRDRLRTAHEDGGPPASRLDDASTVPAVLEGLRPRRRERSVRTPLVTAVVPYFHDARWIADALASLAGQTHRRLDVVVVNDGGFDHDDEDVYDLAARHRARVISTANEGVAAARAVGVRHAEGEHVVFLDADNVARPTWIARLVDAVEREPDLGYVTSWLRMIDEDGDEIRRGPWQRYCPIGNADPVVDRVNVAGDTAALVPRACFEEVGWEDEQMMVADWTLYRAMRRVGRHGLVIPEELILYRVRSSNMTDTYGFSRERIDRESAAQVAAGATSWLSTTS